MTLEVEAGPGATALVASQGANRVYRSPRGCGSDLVARVEEGALLAVVPDPTACFTGARYSQVLDVRLAPGASLVLADTVTSGRGASGERWAFSHSTSTLRVHVGGHALGDERWLLDPSHGPLPERLGRFNALSSVLLVWLSFLPALLGDDPWARRV